MTASTLPYLASPGSLTKALDKIKSAATPERVTYDFISTIIGVKGGGGRSLIPFLKRSGLVKTDGSPSELYNQFRNPSSSKAAAAAAFRISYKALLEKNEFAHSLSDEDLKGTIVEITGDKPDSSVTRLTLATIKAFKAFCDFESKSTGRKHDTHKEVEKESIGKTGTGGETKDLGIRIGYNINLNLPATDDIRVFDAIFRSLKEHLLKE